MRNTLKNRLNRFIISEKSPNIENWDAKKDLLIQKVRKVQGVRGYGKNH